MAKYKRNCRTCMMCKGNQKLRARIRHAAFHRQDGEESLINIAEDIGISKPQIYNHVKKHLDDDSDRYEELHKVKAAKQLARVEAQVQKEMELELDKSTVDEIESRPMEIISLDSYIAQGKEMIDKGQLRITPNSFLAAVKIKTDWASKQQHNKLEFLRTITAFRSGANKQAKEENIIDGTITTEPAESLDRGEKEAVNIYRATFGDATASGAEGVHS